jgi:hypothetical protein
MAALDKEVGKEVAWRWRRRWRGRWPRRRAPEAGKTMTFGALDSMVELFVLLVIGSIHPEVNFTGRFMVARG